MCCPEHQGWWLASADCAGTDLAGLGRAGQGVGSGQLVWAAVWFAQAQWHSSGFFFSFRARALTCLESLPPSLLPCLVKEGQGDQRWREESLCLPARPFSCIAHTSNKINGVNVCQVKLLLTYSMILKKWFYSFYLQNDGRSDSYLEGLSGDSCSITSNLWKRKLFHLADFITATSCMVFPKLLLNHWLNVGLHCQNCQNALSELQNNLSTSSSPNRILHLLWRKSSCYSLL